MCAMTVTIMCIINSYLAFSFFYDNIIAIIITIGVCALFRCIVKTKPTKTSCHTLNVTALYLQEMLDADMLHSPFLCLLFLGFLI